MRTNLVVPFSEKDRAKKLGAKWDAARKVWYVEGVENLGAFAEWLPGQRTKPPLGTEIPSLAAPPVPAKQLNPPRATPAGVMTGAKALSVSCDCLPWVGCDKCRPALEAMGWGKA